MTTARNLGDIVISGSHLQGHIQASLSTLVIAFGEGFESQFEDIGTEWALEVTDDDGAVYDATIYNRTTKNGRDLLPGHWAVGGFRREVVDVILKHLEN